MGTWGTIILIFAGMWLVQVALTLVQSRHYSLTVREMSAYGPGYLGVGVAKKRLGVGSVVILVSDLSGKVVEAREMTGVTLFARFRKEAGLVGKPLEAFEAEADGGSRAQAIQMAVKRIREQQRKKEQEQNT